MPEKQFLISVHMTGYMNAASESQAESWAKAIEARLLDIIHRQNAAPVENIVSGSAAEPARARTSESLEEAVDSLMELYKPGGTLSRTQMLDQLSYVREGIRTVYNQSDDEYAGPLKKALEIVDDLMNKAAGA